MGTRKLETVRYIFKNKILSDLKIFWYRFLPQHQPVFSLWRRKINDGVKPPDEGHIYVVSEVGSQNHQTIITFDSLEQVRNFLVCIFIVGIPHAGPLSKNGIRFIEEEDPIFVFRFVKQR